MIRHTIYGPKKKRKIRFPGVKNDAQALGVHIRTLQRVLSGEWPLKTLHARYLCLKGKRLTAAQRRLVDAFHFRQGQKAATL